MTTFLLGTKIGMTQQFAADGKVTPVTLISIEPNVVVQVKTKDRDGYEAIQIGTGKAKRLTKADRGHRKELGNIRVLREVRGNEINNVPAKQGDSFDASVFAAGDLVKVSGISKGKGFAGAMKRHGFSGMPMGHGHKHVARHIGSIGQRFPQHTLKGKKMAGRMGKDQVTIRGLRVMHVDPQQGLVVMKGAVPGNRGSLLMLEKMST